MCAALDISERTYYKYRNSEDKDYYDYLLIKEIFDESKGTYGYRRICEGLLIKYGVIYNHKKIKRIMSKYNIKPNYAKRKDVHGLIIHSDQGFQYTSYEYKAICESNGIQISMSRKGTPIDDSPMESFHSILKKKTLYNNNITNLEEYIALVEDWLEFYNTKRLKNKRR